MGSVLFLVVTPLIPARTILVHPATIAPPLAAHIALSAQTPSLGCTAKSAGAQLGIGERGQGNQSGRASHRGHDEAHERVEDCPGEEFPERSRVFGIGST